MSAQPTFETERLLLRAFSLSDVPEVQRLAGAREVASTTLNIPHPYEDGMAEAWISTHAPNFAAGQGCTFAITRRPDGCLLGAISLEIAKSHGRAELGYWIGVPYWGQGYCTEAARAVVAHGFRDLGLARIHARHFASNPASGRVMQKIGMTREGCLRQHVLKWDQREDVVVYGLLREEWEALQAGQQAGTGWVGCRRVLATVKKRPPGRPSPSR